MVDLEVTSGTVKSQEPSARRVGNVRLRPRNAGPRSARAAGRGDPQDRHVSRRAGNPTPRTVETASGMLNAIGLDNDGIAHFREHHLPYLRTVGTAVIANIAGEDEDQFVAMAEMLGTEPGLAAIELNISCPEREPRARPRY